MSCYNPCFIQRFTDIYTGEVTTKFLGSVKNVLECNDVLREKYSGTKTNDLIYRTQYKTNLCEFIQIPCGHCIGCRIDYKRSWADRLTYHSLGKEKNSYFITLTYDDEHLYCLEHSPIYDLYSINFNDLSAFVKACRNKFRSNEISFYASSEYGDSNFRPHFHLIIFDLPLDDLEFWKLDNFGAPIYTSDTVDKLWRKGISSISKFSWLNAAYTAGYVEKKLNGHRSFEYEACGLSPEGCRMSRRPGLAFDYYKEHYSDIWKNNGLNVSRSVNSSGHLGIPRYFRKLATDGYYDKKIGEFVVLGNSEFLEWKDNILNSSNIHNSFAIENSSFDLSRINDMLAFQEREILSRQKNKSL